VRLTWDTHRYTSDQEEVGLLQTVPYVKEIVRWRHSLSLELLAKDHCSLGARLLPSTEKKHARSADRYSTHIANLLRKLDSEGHPLRIARVQVKHLNC